MLENFFYVEAVIAILAVIRFFKNKKLQAVPSVSDIDITIALALILVLIQLGLATVVWSIMGPNHGGGLADVIWVIFLIVANFFGLISSLIMVNSKSKIAGLILLIISVVINPFWLIFFNK